MAVRHNYLRNMQCPSCFRQVVISRAPQIVYCTKCSGREPTLLDHVLNKVVGFPLPPSPDNHPLVKMYETDWPVPPPSTGFR